jgi:DNA-binding winged helix-turn-helix (wHTH) protein
MAEADMLRIGSMILDPARACLRREDGTEIALRPKSLDLLVVLARSAGRVVTRDALLDAVWPNIFVNSDSVAQCVQDVRRALISTSRSWHCTGSRCGASRSKSECDSCVRSPLRINLG